MAGFLKYFFTGIIFLVSFFSFSQIQQIQKKNEVLLTTYIGDVRSIKINQSQFNVSLAIDNLTDLKNKQSLTQVNHIQVTSTSEYQIQVVASSELKGKTESIPVNTVSIVPSLGNANSFNEHTIYLSPVSLSTDSQNIIQSFKGDILRTFDVSYNVASLAKYIYNKPADIYSTIITYSIVSN